MKLTLTEEQTKQALAHYVNKEKFLHNATVTPKDVVVLRGVDDTIIVEIDVAAARKNPA